MLILSRKKDERIVIPSHGIEIVVTRIEQDKVRIGIEADRDVVILREELLTDRRNAA